jgi:Flp pilus assembly pilin Flp
MRKMLRKLMKDESGASLIEYVLLAAIIGIGAVAAMQLVSTAAQGGLNDAAAGMNTR